MYIMPFGMSNQSNNNGSAIDELDKTIKFYEAMKKSFNEDKDKDKKKDPPKPNQVDVVTKAMFFVFATPFVMTVWVYLMTQMAVGFLEAITKIKGLH